MPILFHPSIRVFLAVCAFFLSVNGSADLTAQSSFDSSPFGASAGNWNVGGRLSVSHKQLNYSGPSILHSDEIRQEFEFKPQSASSGFQMGLIAQRRIGFYFAWETGLQYERSVQNFVFEQNIFHDLTSSSNPWSTSTHSASQNGSIPFRTEINQFFNTQTHHLKMPMILQARFTNSPVFLLEGGVYGDWHFGTSGDIIQETSQWQDFDAAEISYASKIATSTLQTDALNWGLVFGLGMEVEMRKAKSLTVGLRFERSMNPILSTPKLMSNQAGLSLAYLFAI